MSKGVGSKNFRMCATCRYWTGCSVRVKSPMFFEFERNEEAVCNMTGFRYRPTHGACSDYEKRLNF
ncbi:MAG TPA: hypothetical protein DEQ65_04305 [Ruminococcaceae bacterium]|nr:hypothetical protein [Oscillospiraceae bacterium]